MEPQCHHHDVYLDGGGHWMCGECATEATWALPPDSSADLDRFSPFVVRDDRGKSEWEKATFAEAIVFAQEMAVRSIGRGYEVLCEQDRHVLASCKASAAVAWKGLPHGSTPTPDWQSNDVAVIRLE